MRMTTSCSTTASVLRGAVRVERQSRAVLVSARDGQREESTSMGRRAYEGGDDIIFGDLSGEVGSSGRSPRTNGARSFGLALQPDLTDIVSCIQLNKDEDPWRKQERIEEIRHMTKKALQVTCRKHGLTIQGGRNELIAKIISHESSHPELVETVKTDTAVPLIDDIFVGLA